MKTTYIAGKYLAICDTCGFRFYNDQLKKDWRGLMVCSHDWETRHPQDFVKARGETPPLPWTRPEAVDIFIPIYISVAIAGIAIAGQAIAGREI